MQNVLNVLIQIFGLLIFMMAVTLLLYYVRSYNNTVDNLNRHIERDIVIINMEK